VREGSADDLDLLERLPTIGREDARSTGDRGNALARRRRRRPLFACWVFRGSAPVVAAAGGVLKLPPDIVMTEDSVTAEARADVGSDPWHGRRLRTLSKWRAAA